MSSDLLLTIVGVLITAVGTLMVILLGWLHIRINKIDRAFEQAKDAQDRFRREFYTHLDQHYVRRDVYNSDSKLLQAAVDSMKGHVEAIFKMLTETLLSKNRQGVGNPDGSD